MFVPFRRSFSQRKTQDVAARAAGSVGRRRNRRRPTLESLETRNLLSVIGPEQRVGFNQATDNLQSDNASSTGGSSVAVWVNAFSSTDHDIWAQRFDLPGNPTGAPIKVDTLESDNSFDPHVSMDSSGNFVVVWTNANLDGTDNIMMRFFSASGSPFTGITRVSNPGSIDFNPDVAVAAGGGSFVISWTHLFSATDWDIDAERFVISGPIPVGQGIFGVNGDANVENSSSVAMSLNGGFDIAYTRESSPGNGDIFASQYNDSGVLLRSVAVNVDSIDEELPSVSMDVFGDAVIAYQAFGADGIYANRLSRLGVVGSRITVEDHDSAIEFNPSVAVNSGVGGFVVAYDTLPLNGSTNMGVHVTEMSASNTVLETHQLSTSTFDPAVSINGSGRYLVTYTRFDSSSGLNDIFSRHDSLS